MSLILKALDAITPKMLIGIAVLAIILRYFDN